MNMTTNLIVDFPPSQQCNSKSSSYNDIMVDATVSLSSSSSSSIATNSCRQGPEVCFSQDIEIRFIPNEVKNRHDLWFSEKEINSFKNQPKLMLGTLKANGLTLAQVAKENIESSEVFMGLDNYMTESSASEIVIRRKMMYRDLMREQKRQRSGVYDAEMFTRVARAHSSWFMNRAFIIAKIHSDDADAKDATR